MSVLMQITTTEKDRKTSAETLLLVSSKVCDFWEDTDGVVFYYKYRDDRREKSVEFKTALTMAQFHQKLNEVANEQYVYVQVTEIYGKFKQALVVNRTYRVNIDQIAYGKNINTTSSYLWIDRGPFELLRLKTTHTIDEIDNIASESFSISTS